MRRERSIVAGVLAGLAVAMMLLPNAALAGPTLKPAFKVRVGWVEAKVVDLHGAPVPRAKVAIVAAGSVTPLVYGYAQADGTFAYKLPAGLYTIYAGWQEFPSGKATFKIAAGEPTHVKVMIDEKLD